jgi:hypothetical protein
MTDSTGLPPRALRYTAYPLLTLLGVAVGLAGSFVQQHTATAAGVSWPVGALAALCGCAGAFFGGAALTCTAAGAALPAVGWFAAVLVLTYGGTGGTVVLPNSVAAMLYLFGGVLLAGVAMMARRFATLNDRARAPRAADTDVSPATTDVGDKDGHPKG